MIVWWYTRNKIQSISFDRPFYTINALKLKLKINQLNAIG